MTSLHGAFNDPPPGYEDMGLPYGCFKRRKYVHAAPARRPARRLARPVGAVGTNTAGTADVVPAAVAPNDPVAANTTRPDDPRRRLPPQDRTAGREARTVAQALYVPTRPTNAGLQIELPTDRDRARKRQNATATNADVKAPGQVLLAAAGGGGCSGKDIAASGVADSGVTTTGS